MSQESEAKRCIQLLLFISCQERAKSGCVKLDRFDTLIAWEALIMSARIWSSTSELSNKPRRTAVCQIPPVALQLVALTVMLVGDVDASPIVTMVVVNLDAVEVHVIKLVNVE